MAWCAQHNITSTMLFVHRVRYTQTHSVANQQRHRRHIRIKTTPESSTITCTWLHFSRFDNLVAFSMIFSMVTSSLCTKEQFSLVHLYCDSHIYPNFFSFLRPLVANMSMMFLLVIYIVCWKEQIDGRNIRKRITRQRLGYSIYNKYTWKSNHIHTRITAAQCIELVYITRRQYVLFIYS